MGWGSKEALQKSDKQDRSQREEMSQHGLQAIGADVFVRAEYKKEGMWDWASADGCQPGRAPVQVLKNDPLLPQHAVFIQIKSIFYKHQEVEIC